MDKPSVAILAGVRWGFLWQRHQALADRFARAGYPTVFVETTGISNPRPDGATLRKVLGRVRSAAGRKAPQENGLVVYSPVTAPPTLGAFRRLNRAFFVPRVARDLSEILGPRPIVVAYPPTRTTLDLVSALDPRLLLYDCADDYRHFPGAPGDIAGTERELISIADLVSCTSTTLLEQVRASRPDAFLSGPAVDYELFATVQGERPPGDVNTVCFLGHASGRRLDHSVLRAVARAGFEVRLLGELDRSDRGLLRTAGIDYRGAIPHRLLPAALAGVDAFVLPYRIDDLTRGISPAKTYECLATGKPVVAAPLPSLEGLSEHVYLAREPGDFVEVLRGLRRLETEERVRARIRIARENSWEARFVALEDALHDALTDAP